MQSRIPSAIDVSPVLYARMPTATMAAAIKPPSMAYSIRSCPSSRLDMSTSDEMIPTMSVWILMEMFVTFETPREMQLGWLARPRARMRGRLTITTVSGVQPPFRLQETQLLEGTSEPALGEPALMPDTASVHRGAASSCCPWPRRWQPPGAILLVRLALRLLRRDDERRPRSASGPARPSRRMCQRDAPPSTPPCARFTCNGASSPTALQRC